MRTPSAPKAGFVPTITPCADQTGDALEPIAVVGFSLKYPQDADSAPSFWSMLREKRCAMTEWPKDRINLEAFYHRDESRDEKVFVPGAHFIKEDLGVFDAHFFGISATEATAMDPQHRILLELAYHALENAGMAMESVYGSKTGVYTGSMADDYKHLVTKDVDDLPKYTATGVSVNMIANRLSWFFNFTGPSVNMDSACSSSLMALDFAVQGLRNGDSDMALVAGSSVILAIEPVLTLMNLTMLSPDGRCYSFDQRANGYSRGEGCGIVLIKRLSDAVRDGDTIRAVIRSTGSNQDGHTPGVTQPSRQLQTSLIRETYEKAGLDFGDTRYFEAHGTGTAIGDPIEADAIGAVFRKYRSPEDPLYIGALKSNIGHLEGGSGVAGLIKTIMILEKGIIPPNATFEQLNPKIDAEFLNLKFPVCAVPWPTDGLRRASVNSFGFGGSNAHAVVDDAYHFLRLNGLAAHHCTVEKPPRLGIDGNQDDVHSRETVLSSIVDNDSSTSERTISGRPGFPLETNGILHDKMQKNGFHAAAGNNSPRILVWSAFDESGIGRLMDSWREYFSMRPAANGTTEMSFLDKIAYTLERCRSSLPWKSFAIVDSASKLPQIKDLMSRPVRSSGRHNVAFAFTGQGAVYNGMGIALLAYPVFEDTLESFDRELMRLGCEWSVFDELKRQEPSTQIYDPVYSQPLTTALQIALFELLKSFNIIPSTVLGHSSGEIAAAYAASGLSLASACKVSYHRGRLASSLKRSSGFDCSMMSVDLSENDMKQCLREFSNKVHVACINSPQNVTVSGDEEAIDLLKAKLDGDNVATHKLRTGVAYHSPQMEQIAAEYARCLQGLESGIGHSSRRITMVSTVTGSAIQDLGRLCTPEYWVSNMVQPVKYAEAVKGTISPSKSTRKLGISKQDIIQTVIELGPHSALQSPTLKIIESMVPRTEATYNFVLSRKQSALETLVNLCGRLWCLGNNVALAKVNQVNDDKVPHRQALVDLPTYPFNHSKRYWHESSLSKHSRLRRQPRHELLGTPVSDWNPLEPRWRKFFNTTQSPWIKDHKVNNKSIYPATGMVVMAIEGAKQLADPTRAITGFEIKDATFSHPIVVDSAEKVEVQLFMRAISSVSSRVSDCYSYWVCVRNEDEWQQNCRGTIHVEYERSRNELDNLKKDEQRKAFYRQKYAQAVATCTRGVKTESMYRRFQSNGLTYGPAFQTMSDLAWDGSSVSTGTLKTFEWTTQQSQHSRQLHTVHPTTLDAAGQLMWVALTKGATENIVNGAAVTRIRSAWISSSGLAYPEATSIRACSTSSLKGLRGTDSSMIAFDYEGNLKMDIRHMETTTVSGNEVLPEHPKVRKICFGMVWRPDIDLMSPEQITSYCKTNSADVVEPTSFYRELGLVLYHYAEKGLRDTQDIDVKTLKPHMQKYVAWLKMQISRSAPEQRSDAQIACASCTQDAETIESMIDRIANTNLEGKFLVSVGKSLESILRGKLEPLDIMFSNGLVSDHYREICNKTSSCRQLRGWLDAVAHKNPCMKVIEIGAGTGSITGHILESLQLHGHAADGEIRLAQYDYTDISKAFFEHAQEKFGSGKARMNFKVLNIEEDPASQGYAEGSYDLVVAAWVLHATHDLIATVRNVRKLLKPLGKLVLLEVTKPDILRNAFAFGLLPGWWLSREKYREWSPCLSQDQWHHILTTEGFSGVDFVFPDYQTEDCRENSIMIATATVESYRSSQSKKITFVVDAASSAQAAVADRVRQISNATDCSTVSICDLATSTLSKYDTVVFLPELERQLLYNLERQEFKGLQEVLRQVQHIIWVGSLDKASLKFPQTAMVLGIARVLCTENVKLSFVTLALEDHGDVELWANKIAHVLDGADPIPEEVRELEFAEDKGLMMINRVVEVSSLNQEVYDKSNPTISIGELSKGPPLALAILNPGFLDSLRFVEDYRCYSELGPDEVEIEVKSVGLNFRDLLVALGRYNANTVGCECAGIITRVGSNCTTVQPGDRVCAAIIGCIYTYARCHFQLAVKIPDTLSFAQGASIPVTGVTAYHSLVSLANLQREDSILIHSGAGGTGQIAIQIAQSIGSEVFVTVGSKEKLLLLMDVYHIPSDHIFYSRDTSFAQDVMRMTHNRGVDVILNSLSGDNLVASWECMAPFGRFIELGKVDVEGNSKLPMSSFANNVSFSAVAVDYMCAKRPDLVRKSLINILKRIEEGKMQIASPLHEYSISNIETAFRFMQGGKNTGKIVLNLGPTETVPMLLNYKPSYSLDPQAAYIIAGGFGGLGRSAARWMAKRGAQNLILLSRSGPRSQAALTLLNELRTLGVRVESPKCDVSSLSSLSAALTNCASMGPVKGCLQAAMELRDSIFDNMSFEDWTTSIKSKVHSSLNLHHLLPQDINFFILLSSVAGIAGSPAQANYAAGNTYQDALAQHRRTLGLRATSIDLGWMADVGIVAENERLSKGNRVAADLGAIREKEFLALLEVYCDPELDHGVEGIKAQPIMGLVTPAQIRAEGLEPPAWIQRPLFSALAQAETMREEGLGSSDGGAAAETEFTTQFVQKESREEAAAVVASSLLQRLSGALSMAVEDIDVTRPPHVYGVDSLLAVELRNWFATVWKADVAVFDITGQVSIAALGDTVAKKSGLRLGTE